MTIRAVGQRNDGWRFAAYRLAAEHLGVKWCARGHITRCMHLGGQERRN
jgi:hypothetical protein